MQTSYCQVTTVFVLYTWSEKVRLKSKGPFTLGDKNSEFLSH